MRVIVTGASGALGQAVCEHLLGQGTSVIGIDLRAPDEPDSRFELQLSDVDLSDATSVQSAMDQITDGGAPLTGLVNVAGGFTWETIMDGSPESWDRMWTMNVKTALNMSRAAVPHLQDHKGAIINIGAGAAAKAGLGMGAYTASKSGVARLTEALAEELKPRGIRVNAVLPSIIDTPANRADMPDAEFPAWVTAQELANAIGFLLSDAASGVTGALLPVSGRV
ncbi:MAG: SDR family oxidoreductase [Henriciella sp.]|nr:SDR family oxidoreductase [Henriciella sp.]